MQGTLGRSCSCWATKGGQVGVWEEAASPVSWWEPTCGGAPRVVWLEPGREGSAISCPHRMKENYILLSTDGPGRNVLKFKPPMCFSVDNARHVVAKMDAILTSKLGAQGGSLELNLQPIARTFQPAQERGSTASQESLKRRREQGAEVWRGPGDPSHPFPWLCLEGLPEHQVGRN